LQGEPVDFPRIATRVTIVKDLARHLLDYNTDIPTDKEQAITVMAHFSGSEILKGIQKDLEDFGVFFDNYYNESTLFKKGVVDDTLHLLKEKGYAYEKDGALWFTTSKFEKDEDRVLIKSGGEKTYFTSDIAYHSDKFNRSFDMLIDLWGSDHHGYIPRLKASFRRLAGIKKTSRPSLSSL
jgi:arginyl-tRNA synthetase